MDRFDPVVNWHEKLLQNKGYCATLKRCKKLAEIYLHPAYVELCQQLAVQGERVALLVGLLSHIKEESYVSKDSFAKQMAACKKGGDVPKISPLRFQHLLTIKDDEKLFRSLIRIINQVDKFDLICFSKDLFYWGEITKRKWAYDYYSIYQESNEATPNQGENT